MHIKLIGACLIIAGSGSVGLSLGMQYMRSYRSIKQLIIALEVMISELQYKLSPLSQLCREAARHTDGAMRKLFLMFSQEIEDQITPDLFQCMCNAIEKNKELPGATVPILKQLAVSMGKYDLDGQVRVVEAVREECRRLLREMDDNKSHRIRSYHTLCLCAGTALAVLLC